MAADQTSLANPAWFANFESFALWSLGAVGLAGGALYRRLDSRAKARAAVLAKLRVDIDQQRVDLDSHLTQTAANFASSLADRKALIESTRRLFDEHHQTREILAGQPTKEDLRRLEDRIVYAVQGSAKRD